MPIMENLKEIKRNKAVFVPFKSNKEEKGNKTVSCALWFHWVATQNNLQNRTAVFFYAILGYHSSPIWFSA